ncbi:polymorphic toxin-type HINT domain-containing protein [Actinoplanes sp. DH11]|uniref:polymorphic toxin-type HINT domain-containing protein n=1 Tax=Actinoplanes sp. DH11 TaxID=2857011 RepID=UPI001E5F8B50|nr:polymorphic toxin-type HINT domain-containing protein [Actinoplanes sp. DH11]
MLPSNRANGRLLDGRRRIATAAFTLLLLPALTSLLAGQPAAAAPKIPDPQQIPRVQLGEPRNEPAVNLRKKYARFNPSTRAELPAPNDDTVTLPAVGKRARAGSSTVSVARPAHGQAPQQVRVSTIDQKTAKAAGVRGVMVALSSEQGSGDVTVNIDPSTFSNAYGGAYASRLRLVGLPACALSTPERDECRTQSPVVTEPGEPLSAKLTLTAASDVRVLAATSGTSGEGGDYSATSLSPSGSWSAGGNTGAFTYSYPINVPQPLGGVAPSLSLSYDSSSQDARTIGTNNQSSWIGDGWTSGDNYIERTYRACTEIEGTGGPKYGGDLCWAGQILTLSLNGKSTAIVHDGTTLRPVEDSSTTKIERLPNATNGTTNKEAFRVTEGGVQYYFGLNRLPGWSAGAEETESAWTVPVYKARAGAAECPDGTFADTACTLGYRFNLDYVVDPNGNAMAYYYDPETGYYGPNMKNTAVSYIRGGTLKRIDYGLTASTIYSAPALNQVTFVTGERCIAGLPAGNTCAANQFSVSNPAYWPDVPIDLNCTSGKDCTNHAPSFWSRRALKAITTTVRVGGVPKPVDRYDLVHDFPDNGDHQPTLFLKSIERTGQDLLGGAGSNVSAGTVTFDPVQLANRVARVTGSLRYYFNRIGRVFSETGAQTVIDYKTPTCAGLPADSASAEVKRDFAAANTTACFPVFWTPEAQPEPLLEWFYTHPVTAVTTYDENNHYQDGTQPKTTTEYTYHGDPGWHYDDNETVKAKHRTWGQFRGYPEVHVITGDTGVAHRNNGNQIYDRKSLTKNYYFRGMNEDTLPGGKKRAAPALVSTDKTITVPDVNEYAGQLFESVTPTADGETVERSTVTVPTKIGPTASRARTGLPELEASMVRTAKVVSRSKVSYGYRKTEMATFYNTTLGQSTTGMPVQSVDRGEVGAEGNQPRCTFTRYLDGSVATLVVQAEIVTTNQDCAQAGASPSGMLTAVARTSYDGNPFARNGDGQANPARPARGNPTLIQQSAAVSGTTVTAFVDVMATTYDSYGRITSTTRTPKSTAPDNSSLAQSTYNRYVPAAGALPTSVTTVTQVTAGVNCSAVTKTSKDCQLSTVTMNPVRQLPTAKTDVAGALTSLTYDALGRLTAVWLPNKSKVAGAPANMTYTYALSSTAPTVVTTKSLLEAEKVGDAPAYHVSKVLYDALLRPLETQETGENGSTIVNDTQYDSHGRTVITNNAYAIGGDPRNELISDRLSQVSIPSVTVTEYDHLGRVTEIGEEHRTEQTWRTRTAYTGDTTIVLPPTGGTATATTVDARGNTTQLKHYTTRPTLTGGITSGFTASGGTTQSIAYQYNEIGQLASFTGPDGSEWGFGYDHRGREISKTDPDAGTSYTGYDDAGNITTSKDARGTTLTHTYDLIGRKLSTSKPAANFKLAAWTYDTLRIGKPSSSSRFVSGVSGSYTVAVTGYTTLGNPLGQTITLPGVERPLPTSYSTTFKYTPNTEMLAQQTDPAVGTLPGEAITYTRSKIGTPTKTAGAELYIADTVYTDFGQPSHVTRGDTTNQAETLYTYEEHTLRLSKQATHRYQAPGPLVDELSYTYDDAGNPLSVTNRQTESGNAVTDNQCYRYDALARLVNAWTATSACPSPATLKPAAADVATATGAYWQSFDYDTVGNRTELVDHSTNGGQDVTTSYKYGCTTGCNTTGRQPHTLTETLGGSDPAKNVYDVSGNLLTRTTGKNNNQSLTWNDEGQLAQVSTSGSSTTVTKYLYDADGNQLIRRDPGRTTLFAGDTEIVVDTSAATAVLLGAVRTYAHGGTGSAIAMRSTLPGGGTHYLINDPHGTATLSMDTTTQKVSRQQFKPYGEPRSSANTTMWPDMTRGYLGAPKNTHTGYTDVGARKYDPAIGRFISIDPLLFSNDPTQLGGYTYAGSNPITYSDPSGLGRQDPDRPGCAPGNGGACDGHETEDDYFDEPNTDDESKTPSGGGGVTGGKGKAREKAKDSCHATCDGQQVLYKKIILRAHLGVEKQNRIIKRFWSAYRYLFCSSNGFCREDPEDFLPYNFTKMLKDVCHGEGGCGSEIDAMTSTPNLLRLATEDFGIGGEGPGGSLTGRGSSKSKKSCHSFDPDTPVLMADGSTKPIRDVRVGDEVLATDPVSGESVAKPVTDLHDHVDSELADVEVVDANGRRLLIETTVEHRFWDESNDAWIAADDLQVGSELRSTTAKRVWAAGVVTHTGSERMLDLTVADIHTYYVLAGKTPVLVHNCGKSIYEAGGKHGPTARSSSRGTNSAEPSNGQGALENSIEWTSEGPGQAPRRIGVSDGEIVIMDRTRQAACGCSRDGGTNDIWHGHVRGWGDLSPGMQSALRKAGLVDRKGRPL